MGIFTNNTPAEQLKSTDEALDEMDKAIESFFASEIFGDCTVQAVQSIFKPHTPEACECGIPASRHCFNCEAPICQHHGYLLENGNAICSPCMDEAELEQWGVARYGRADA